MSARKIGYALSSLMVGITLFACSGANMESADEENSDIVAGQKNLCVGQAANTFHCIDDTRFEECVGNNAFVVNSCPKGLCATRHPSNKNPCVGADRAAQIDGVPPTPPNQIDDNPAGASTTPPPANTTPPPASTTPPPVSTPPPPANNNNGGQCVGGPKFDPAGVKNVGNGHGGQFIGGQCLSTLDCASGCCALPCGICSGPGAQFQAGKQGCGFVAH